MASVRAQRGYFKPKISLWWPPGFCFEHGEKKQVFQIFYYQMISGKKKTNSQIFVLSVSGVSNLK